MRSMRVILIGVTGLFLGVAMGASASAADRKAVASGKTQVVAKLNNREITISDLRAEMTRLGLPANAENAERIALENIVTRALLAGAAREANLHRQPEALRRIAIAQEQAIADYFLAAASQSPEPTRVEIEDYIAANPGLFYDRKVYDFAILSLPTAAFDEEKLNPLFDKSEDFAALQSALEATNVDHSIAPAVQPSTAFPEPIRKQLAEYGVRDNIVLKGETDTQIMKIIGVTDAPASRQTAPAIARQALLQLAARDRAQSVIERLRQKSKLAYYRKSAAPAQKDKVSEK